jgi:acetolactate synthase-1/2/3 large subunit
LINQARRPVIYAGQGVLQSDDGPELLRQLALTAGIPVTTTLQGMGAFDEMHPLSLHMLGMHGSAYANLAMQHADLILAMGARFDDRVTGNLAKFAPEAKRAATEGRGGIVHFEISPKNINKIVESTVAIEGDLGSSLREVLPLLKQQQRPTWMQQLDEWKRRYPFRYDNAFTERDESRSQSSLKPQQVLEEINRQLSQQMADNRVTVTTGVGQHQMWAGKRELNY